MGKFYISVKHANVKCLANICTKVEIIDWLKSWSIYKTSVAQNSFEIVTPAGFNIRRGFLGALRL